MKELELLLPVLMLIIGVVLMFRTTRNNRNLLNGNETRLGKYFLGAILFGLWIFLISVGGILAIGSLSEIDGWTTYQIVEIFLLGVFISVMAVVGALWQFFIATKFRETLYELLKRKNR